METEIKKRRRELLDIDRNIVALLHRRAELARLLGQLKESRRQPMYSPANEEKVFANLIAPSRGAFPPSGLRKVFKEIISACRALQEKMPMAVLGTGSGGAFRQAKEAFGGSAALIPCRSLDSFLTKLRTGKVSRGFLSFPTFLREFKAFLPDLGSGNLSIVAEWYPLGTRQSMRFVTLSLRPNEDFHGTLKGTFFFQGAPSRNIQDFLKSHRLTSTDLHIIPATRVSRGKFFLADVEMPPRESTLLRFLDELGASFRNWKFLGFYPAAKPDPR